MCIRDRGVAGPSAAGAPARHRRRGRPRLCPRTGRRLGRCCLPRTLRGGGRRGRWLPRHPAWARRRGERAARGREAAGGLPPEPARFAWRLGGMVPGDAEAGAGRGGMRARRRPDGRALGGARHGCGPLRQDVRPRGGEGGRGAAGHLGDGHRGYGCRDGQKQGPRLLHVLVVAPRHPFRTGVVRAGVRRGGTGLPARARVRRRHGGNVRRARDRLGGGHGFDRPVRGRHPTFRPEVRHRTVLVALLGRAAGRRPRPATG